MHEYFQFHRIYNETQSFTFSNKTHRKKKHEQCSGMKVNWTMAMCVVIETNQVGNRSGSNALHLNTSLLSLEQMQSFLSDKTSAWGSWLGIGCIFGFLYNFHIWSGNDAHTSRLMSVNFTHEFYLEHKFIYCYYQKISWRDSVCEVDHFNLNCQVPNFMRIVNLFEELSRTSYLILRKLVKPIAADSQYSRQTYAQFSFMSAEEISWDSSSFIRFAQPETQYRGQHTKTYTIILYTILLLNVIFPINSINFALFLYLTFAF